MSEPPVEPESLSVELLRRSAVVLEFTAAQVEAWCSGLFAVWENDDEASQFVDHCREVGGSTAALVCRGLAAVGNEHVAALAGSAAEALAADLLPNGASIGSITLQRAWTVSGPDSRSIIFGCGADESDHSLLFELDTSGSLVDIQVGDRPQSLLSATVGPDVDVHPDAEADNASDDADDPDPTKDDLAELNIAETRVDEALAEVRVAWERAAAVPASWPSSTEANEHVARRRLEAALGDTLGPLQHAQAEVTADSRRGLDADEFRQANEASLSTLRSALGALPDASDGADQAEHQAWTAVITGSVPNLDATEAEALLWLEWADWLGVGLGLLRSKPGCEVDADALITMVNRCPEVSSSIDARDREWATYAFDIVVEYLTDHEVIVDGSLSERGHRFLGPAMAAAWSVDASG